MRDEIVEQTHRLLGDQVTPELLQAADRGEWPAPVWASIETAGLPLALVAAARGGVGLEPADAFAIVRAAAYHALPAPLAETMLAQRIWTDAGGPIIPGAVSFALPAAEAPLRLAGERLTGTLARVPWGRTVERVVTIAEDNARRLFIVAADPHQAEASAGASLAGEPRDRLRFEGIPAAVRPAAIDYAALERAGALARSLQMVGAMERALELTIAYVNQREQFGRALAKFQAVQQSIAVAAARFALAAAATGAAARAFASDQEPTAVAVAKSLAGEAARIVAEAAHQMHAAMGFTREYPLHFFTRRLWAWREEFGRETVWEARLGAAACAAGGAALWPALVNAHASNAAENR